MGIEKFIKKVCVQTAVYWAPVAATGYGGFTFDEPVEIQVRWDEKTAVVTALNGQEFICDVAVLVTQDLKPHGYLFLGMINDLDSGQMEDPMTVPMAFPIVVWEKIPMIKSTREFVRKAYLQKAK